jgi:hypothetical protein
MQRKAIDLKWGEKIREIFLVKRQNNLLRSGLHPQHHTRPKRPYSLVCICWRKWNISKLDAGKKRGTFT